MAWVYLDDHFPDHPKVVAAGGDAAWVFVCGLAYCKRYETAGRIPKAQVARLTDRRHPAKLASTLVHVGLWEEDGDHYVVHDYHHWNKPQESRSAAGRKAAQARWSKDRTHANRSAIASESHDERTANADASTCPPPHPYTDTSSSNSRKSRRTQPADGTAGEEESKPIPIGRAATLDATWRRLAEHDRQTHTAAGGTIRQPERWLTKAAETRRAAHEVQALTELAARPDLTADQLAETLDPACGPDDGGATRAAQREADTQAFLAKYRHPAAGGNDA